MSQESLLACSFLIPIHRDADIADGLMHEPVAQDWLRYRLLTCFGGCTVAPGLYSGMWRVPKTGRVISDQSHRFVVAVPDGELGVLRDLLAEACHVFAQQCILVEIAGRIEFIEASEHVPTIDLPGPEEA